jgi:hypothetical protein
MRPRLNFQCNLSGERDAYLDLSGAIFERDQDGRLESIVNRI